VEAGPIAEGPQNLPTRLHFSPGGLYLLGVRREDLTPHFDRVHPVLVDKEGEPTYGDNACNSIHHRDILCDLNVFAVPAAL